MTRLSTAVFAAFALLASGASAQVCSTSWTNPGGGAWTTAANWDNGVPTAASDACITLDATYTVTLDANASVSSLTLGTTAGVGTQTLLNSNRTLTMSAASTIQARGVYDWQGGNTGAAATLTNDGRIEMSGAAIKDFGSNTTIRNRAVATLDGTGQMRFLGGGVTFINTAGATFSLLSDADFSIFNGGNTFTNEGLFRKTGGTDVSQVSQSSLDFDNAGTVEAVTGTIRFTGNGTHTDGVFTAAAGAEVFFDAGTHTIVGTLTGTPVGTVRLDSGAVLVDDGSGATLDVGGTGLEWQSGNLNGTLTSVNLLRLTTAGTKDIGLNAVLTNTALVEMTDTGLLRFLGSASVFVNATGATFDIQSDAGFTVFNSGNTFTNNGLFRKTGSTGVSQVSQASLDFDNAGTVEALTGTIRFTGNGTHTDGVFTASAGAEVFFDAGTHTIVGTLTGTPAGIVRFDAGATLTGGTLDMDGTGFEWQAGNFGTLTNTGLLRLTTASTKDINASSTVTNTALVEMTDAGPMRFLGSASAFVNAAGATFDIQSDADFTTFNSGNTFTNSGLFRKTGGGGLSQISNASLTFTNASGGVVSAESGTLDANGAFSHQSGARIEGTATFDRAGSTPFVHDGDVSPGTAAAAVGQLRWTGAYAPGASASLTIDLAPSVVARGAASTSDRLLIPTSATLGGTLVLRVPDTEAPTTGQVFVVVEREGAATITGTFAAVTGPPGYTFDVTYSPTVVVVTITAVGVTTALTSPTASALAGEGFRMLAASTTGATYDDLIGTLWTQGFPGADYAAGGVPNAYTYSEASTGAQAAGYLPLTSQSASAPLGTGFFVNVYADDDFDGPLAPSFPKTITQSGPDVSGAFVFPGLTYTSTGVAEDDGWNLVGNPYAASMDWDAAGWTKTNLDNVFYVYDQGTGDYRSWNGAAGSFGSGLVAPAQGFWVHATGAPALEAPAEARTTGGAFAGRDVPAGAVVGLHLADASGRPLAASAYVTILDGASDGADRFDAYELVPFGRASLALSTARVSDGLPLDIQALAPSTEALQLAVSVAARTAGAPDEIDVVLTWPQIDGFDGPVSLRDRVTGAVVDLRAETAYAFTLTETVARPAEALAGAPARPVATTERFTLVLGDRIVSDAPAAEAFVTALAGAAPNPVRSRSQIRYSLAEAGAATVTVHDLLGREIARLADGEQSAGAHTASLDASALASGVYVVRLQAGGESHTTRIAVVR